MKKYTDTCDFLNHECVDDYNDSELKDLCSVDVYEELKTIRVVGEDEYSNMYSDGVAVLETVSNLYVRADICADYNAYSRDYYTAENAVNEEIYNAIKWYL